jgi:hypothetical protein
VADLDLVEGARAEDAAVLVESPSAIVTAVPPEDRVLRRVVVVSWPLASELACFFFVDGNDEIRIGYCGLSWTMYLWRHVWVVVVGKKEREKG